MSFIIDTIAYQYADTLIYVASFAAYVPQRFNPRAVLVSSVQRITQESCVRFELYYFLGVEFSVRVPKCVYTATDVDDFGLLLDVTTGGLGDTWHNLWLPLRVTTQCDAQIQFEVLYDTSFAIQTSAAIGDVTVLNNGCLGML